MQEEQIHPLLKKKITAFPTVMRKNEPHYLTLGQAIKRLQSPPLHSAKLIQQVRSGLESLSKKERREIKEQIPVICFSGVLESRFDDKLTEHSGFIIIDFDDIDPDDAKSFLALDEYSFLIFKSTSGNGVKVLVRITNPERHRDHFRALKTYYEKQYNLTADPTGINESRACFDSLDEDLILNLDAKPFGHMISETADNQKAGNSSAPFTDYEQLNIACRMIRRAEDGQKHNTLLRAAVLCGGFISAGKMEEDEVVRVLMREIVKKDIISEQNALATIHDGIQKGKLMPVGELMVEKEKMAREMRINDGDMSFISSDDEDFKWIDDFAEGKIIQGLTTGHEEIDKYWRFKKNFTIINGHSNIGKTTFALYLMVLSAVRHDWRWVIYTSENRTASVKMKLMSFLTGKDLKTMTYRQRKAAFEWVKSHFTVISNDNIYSVYDILIFAEKIMKQQKTDGLLIDPYNGLRKELGTSGMGVHEYDYEAASQMLTAANSKGIAVWLNTHAVTEAQRMKGDDGLPIAPFAEQTEGGGKFVNRADDFLTFHRKIQHPEQDIRRTVEMHVRKIRETETGGEPTPLDRPLLFEMNGARNSFYFQGEALFHGDFIFNENQTLFS